MDSPPASISDALRLFCEACLPRLHRLKSHVSESAFTKYLGVSSLEPNRQVTTKVTPIFDHRYLVASALPHFVEMPEYVSAANSLTNDDVIGPQLNALHGTFFLGSVRLQPEGVLRRFLTELIRRVGDLQFNGALFDDLLVEMWKYFSSDSIAFVSRAPLLQFSTSLPDPIDLGDGVRIRPGPTSVEEELRQGPGSINTFFLLQPSTRILEVEFSAKKVIGQGDEGSDSVVVPNPGAAVITQVVSTLRLLKRGAVGVGYEETQSATWIPSIGKDGHLRMESPRPLVAALGYQLEAEDVPILAKLWRSRRRESTPVGKWRSYDVALNRFNSSYECVRSEDHIIDLMIAFEALYLGDTEQSELSYRLAIRTAVFLGITAHDRQSVFASIKSAYSLRSSVVHGRRPKEWVTVDGEQVHLSEFVFRVEDLLRRSLRRFSELLDSTAHKAILADLDSRVFEPPG